MKRGLEAYYLLVAGMLLVLLQDSFAESVWQSQQKHIGSAAAGGGWRLRSNFFAHLDWVIGTI
jgi:hypothetical protein